MVRSAIDFPHYGRLAEIWFELPKTLAKPYAGAVSVTQDCLVTPDTYFMPGTVDYASGLVDGSDWLLPMARYPRGLPSSILSVTKNVALIASALDGGRVIVSDDFSGRTRESLSTEQHVWRALIFYYQHKEPLDAAFRRIRFSTTQRAFGCWLRFNEPSVSHDEREIRSFFRRYASEAKKKAQQN